MESRTPTPELSRIERPADLTAEQDRKLALLGRESPFDLGGQPVVHDRGPSAELFGRGTINLGEIEGGLAANVVAPEATAEVLVRTVEEPAAVEERLRSHLGEHVELVSGKGYVSTGGRTIPPPIPPRS